MAKYMNGTMYNVDTPDEVIQWLGNKQGKEAENQNLLR